MCCRRCLRTPQDASGRFRTPQDASGRFRTPQDATGRHRTPLPLPLVGSILLKNPSGFDQFAFSGALSASKYANPTDEMRHSAHPRKVTNLLNNFRASIGPKSKTRIFKIRRENKLNYRVSTCRFNGFSAIPAYFFD